MLPLAAIPGRRLFFVILDIFHGDVQRSGPGAASAPAAEQEDATVLGRGIFRMSPNEKRRAGWAAWALRGAGAGRLGVVVGPLAVLGGASIQKRVKRPCARLGQPRP